MSSQVYRDILRHDPPLFCAGLPLKGEALSNSGQDKDLGFEKGKGIIQILDAKAFRKEEREWEKHGTKGEAESG